MTAALFSEWISQKLDQILPISEMGKMGGESDKHITLSRKLGTGAAGKRPQYLFRKRHAIKWSSALLDNNVESVRLSDQTVISLTNQERLNEVHPTVLKAFGASRAEI